MNLLALATYLTLISCSAAMPAKNDPADANGKTTPIASGAGVLRPGFDPDTLAPSAEPKTAAAHDVEQPAAATSYTCPHHPEVVSATPGKCPKCGMDLQPAKPGAGSSTPAHDHGAHDHGKH